MTELTFEHLLAACSAGGASAMSIVTELGPAAGAHAGVAPARYVDGRSNATYLFQTRYVDDEPTSTVMLDSKGSTANRVEEQIALAIRDGIDPLARTPRLHVTYPDADYMSLELPHRAFDGHIRAGTIDGGVATADERYRAVRNATPSDARALLEACPASLAFGAWDSTRKSHQGRYRSALVGEMIGVLADQGPEGRQVPRSGGARVDPYAPSVQLSGPQMASLVDAQREELSAGNVTSLESQISKAKNSKVSGSKLGLGAIPPTLNGLGTVACSRIIRSFVVSFSTLRGMRFGAGPDGDAACRALLAAFALAGVARAQSDLRIRANCDLVELSQSDVQLDARHGNTVSVEPITIDTADAILAAAIDAATSTAGIRWEGQILEVVGNPAIAEGAAADGDE